MPFRVKLPPDNVGRSDPESGSPLLSTEPVIPVMTKESLWDLLNVWAGLDERKTPEVDRLKDKILDIFQANPDEADVWFKEWRASHQVERLS